MAKALAVSALAGVVSKLVYSARCGERKRKTRGGRKRLISPLPSKRSGIVNDVRCAAAVLRDSFFFFPPPQMNPGRAAAQSSRTRSNGGE